MGIREDLKELNKAREASELPKPERRKHASAAPAKPKQAKTPRPEPTYWTPDGRRVLGWSPEGWPTFGRDEQGNEEIDPDLTKADCLTEKPEPPPPPRAPLEEMVADEDYFDVPAFEANHPLTEALRTLIEHAGELDGPERLDLDAFFAGIPNAAPYIPDVIRGTLNEQRRWAEWDAKPKWRLEPQYKLAVLVERLALLGAEQLLGSGDPQAGLAQLLGRTFAPAPRAVERREQAEQAMREKQAAERASLFRDEAERRARRKLKAEAAERERADLLEASRQRQERLAALVEEELGKMTDGDATT